jgi:hypothetical protein
MLNIATFAPMPSASVAVAASVKPGLCANVLNAYRMSRQKVLKLRNTSFLPSAPSCPASPSSLSCLSGRAPGARQNITPMAARRTEPWLSNQMVAFSVALP